MRTPVSSIVLYLVASLLGAAGQFLYKTGADRATGGAMSYLANVRLLGGVVCYVGVMAMFVGAFKRGGDIAAPCPIYATTFIWAALIAWAAFGTPITATHVAGMALLITGMYLMGR